MLRLEVLEDGALPERDDPNLDACGSQHVDLFGSGGRRVGPDDGRRPVTQASAGQRRIGDSPARPPAARVVRVDVAADVADVDDIEFGALEVS